MRRTMLDILLIRRLAPRLFWGFIVGTVLFGVVIFVVSVATKTNDLPDAATLLTIMLGGPALLIGRFVWMIRNGSASKTDRPPGAQTSGHETEDYLPNNPEYRDAVRATGDSRDQQRKPEF